MTSSHATCVEKPPTAPRGTTGEGQSYFISSTSGRRQSTCKAQHPGGDPFQAGLREGAPLFGALCSLEMGAFGSHQFPSLLFAGPKISLTWRVFHRDYLWCIPSTLTQWLCPLSSFPERKCHQKVALMTNTRGCTRPAYGAWDVKLRSPQNLKSQESQGVGSPDHYLAVWPWGLDLPPLHKEMIHQPLIMKSPFTSDLLPIPSI